MEGDTLVVTSLFTDNMVLQRAIHGPDGEQIPATTIHGRAPTGTRIELTRTPAWQAGNPLSAIADATGDWGIQVENLDPQPDDPANNFELTLSITGGTPVPIHVVNISYGDVILCSGQSNMALNLHPIYDNDTIISEAHHPEIRLFYVAAQGALTPQDSVQSSWVQTTPETVVQFSAICYLTALEIQRLRYPSGGRPVLGLIGSAVGSTDVQSWMSMQALDHARTTCWVPNGASML